MLIARAGDLRCSAAVDRFEGIVLDEAWERLLTCNKCP